MDWSFSQILTGIIFGAIGLWFVKEGKRLANLQVLAIGVVLMIVPALIPNIWVNWLVCIGLCLLAKRLW